MKCNPLVTTQMQVQEILDRDAQERAGYGGWDRTNFVEHEVLQITPAEDLQDTFDGKKLGKNYAAIFIYGGPTEDDLSYHAFYKQNETAGLRWDVLSYVQYVEWAATNRETEGVN